LGIASAGAPTCGPSYTVKVLHECGIDVKTYSSDGTTAIEFYSAASNYLTFVYKQSKHDYYILTL